MMDEFNFWDHEVSITRYSEGRTAQDTAAKEGIKSLIMHMSECPLFGTMQKRKIGKEYFQTLTVLNT